LALIGFVFYGSTGRYFTIISFHLRLCAILSRRQIGFVFSTTLIGTNPFKPGGSLIPIVVHRDGDGLGRFRLTIKLALIGFVFTKCPIQYILDNLLF